MCRDHLPRTVWPVTIESAQPSQESGLGRVRWWDPTWRVVLALLLGAVSWWYAVLGPGPFTTAMTTYIVAVDPFLGFISCALVPLRRHRPMLVAVLVTLLRAGSTSAAGAQAVVLASVATRRRPREVLPLGVLTGAAVLVSYSIYPVWQPRPLWVEALGAIGVTVVVVAVGWVVGARRGSAHARVERERALRVARSRETEAARDAAGQPQLPDRTTWWAQAWRVVLALVVGVGLWLASIVENPDISPFVAVWRMIVEPFLGILALSLLLVRRRWPLGVGIVTTLLSAVSTVAVGAQTIVLCSVATRQRWQETAPLAALTVAAGLVNSRLFPIGDPLALWAEALVGALITAMIVAVGYAVGSRRALVRAWVDRARTAEAEQRARVAQARAGERTEIAREMHDVLAHRISLVTMHSGLLSYRQDLPEEERRAAVSAIDENARAALTELREVLGVLRDPSAVEGPLQPHAGLDLLEDLVQQARSAGTPVEVRDDAGEREGLTPSVSRTAYRVVQEGLTNARKHAPGAQVVIALGGGAGRGLEVEVTNPRAVRRSAPSVPGSGLGLLGLTERVELVGGRLEHGWTPDGRHRLAVSLPWPA